MPLTEPEWPKSEAVPSVTGLSSVSLTPAELLWFALTRTVRWAPCRTGRGGQSAGAEEGVSVGGHGQGRKLLCGGRDRCMAGTVVGIHMQ